MIGVKQIGIQQLGEGSRDAMPRYPARREKWMDLPYGGNEDAWEEAKEQCRDALYRRAAAGRFGTYTALTNEVTAIAWPDGAFTHGGRQNGLPPWAGLVGGARPSPGPPGAL